jgi:hypothetical protein
LQTKDDENFPKLNTFYFNAYKSEDYEKHGGVIKNAEFYKSIKRNNKNFIIDISHPDINGEPEFIEMRCLDSELNTEIINKMYKVYIKDVLLPILKSIK